MTNSHSVSYVFSTQYMFKVGDLVQSSKGRIGTVLSIGPFQVLMTIVRVMWSDDTVSRHDASDLELISSL